MTTPPPPAPAQSFRAPIRLLGRYVHLVPLERRHAPALFTASRDPQVGRFLARGIGETLPAFEEQIDRFLAGTTGETELPFCQVLAGTGVPIGVTWFLRIDRDNQSVEVGGTWLGRRWWRTPVNTEAKFLLFRHAFETEGFRRVWLQTDLRNERSQRAIARLGAMREGVLREDRLVRNGYVRSSVIYSVLADEWPRVRTRLEAQLARPWEPSAPAVPQVER